MELKQALGRAIRQARLNRHLTQEDFADVSGRTYLSALERGLKSPTLDKLHELSSVIGVHPLTLLTSCYLQLEETLTIEELFSRIRTELNQGEHEPN